MTELQRHRGAKAQSDRVAKAQRCKVTKGQRRRGTEAQSNRGTEAQRVRDENIWGNMKPQRHRVNLLFVFDNTLTELRKS